MKRKIILISAVLALLITTCACSQKEDSTKFPGTIPTPAPEVTDTPVPTVEPESAVDYTGTIMNWMYYFETDVAQFAHLNTIDTCKYGTAGASLSQVNAAVSMLKLSTLDSIEICVDQYFNAMNVTQLDFFSFQWQMSYAKALAILTSPKEYAGLLNDSGNSNVDLTVFSVERLDSLNETVLRILADYGVKDEWKNCKDMLPFSMG